jgi:hypothetical protein
MRLQGAADRLAASYDDLARAMERGRAAGEANLLGIEGLD